MNKRFGKMDQKVIILTIATWFVFMILAIINAIIRNSLFKPMIGDLGAHQVSTIIFTSIILIVTYIVFKFSKIELSLTDTFIIGSIWLFSTICFEFLAGHFVFGNSWEKLFFDYNILKGRIWSFVLITIFFSPYISNRFL